jgi:hypothetical protein
MTESSGVSPDGLRWIARNHSDPGTREAARQRVAEYDSAYDSAAAQGVFTAGLGGNASQLDTIQAVVDDAIAHGERTISTLSSNYDAVKDALTKRGMYVKSIWQDRLPLTQRTCTLEIAPVPNFGAMNPILPGRELNPGTPTYPGTARAGYPIVGTVSVGRHARPLEPISAKPAPKPRPDYFTLHEQYIRTGDPKILKRMLSKVNRTSPDLDVVRAKPQPETPYLDRLRRHDGDISAALRERDEVSVVKMRHRSNVWPVNLAAAVLGLAVMMILLGSPLGLRGLLMLIPAVPNALMFCRNYKRVPA